jgi:hypothetical protein
MNELKSNSRSFSDDVKNTFTGFSKPISAALLVLSAVGLVDLFISFFYSAAALYLHATTGHYPRVELRRFYQVPGSLSLGIFLLFYAIFQDRKNRSFTSTRYFAIALLGIVFMLWGILKYTHFFIGRYKGEW